MQTKRSSAHLAIGLLLAMTFVAVACGGDDDDATSTTTTLAPKAAASALGEPNKATGTPIKVGLISNGVGQGFDQSNDGPVAEATANWINEYRGGIGGHPITLVKCEDQNDPSKAADCANDLIRQDVVAVVYSSNGIFEASWRPLSEAGIPTFIQAVTGQDSAKEATNTFTIQNGLASTVDGPIDLATDVKSEVFSVLSVDVPAATSNYTDGAGPQKIEDGTEVTADAITKAAKSMPWTEQPGSGGRHMQCNGKADPEQPAICQNGLLYGSLGEDAKPTTYQVVNDEEPSS